MIYFANLCLHKEQKDMAYTWPAQQNPCLYSSMIIFSLRSQLLICEKMIVLIFFLMLYILNWM